MEDLDNFKKFVNFCKSENILCAKLKDMEVQIKYEPKIVELETLNDDNEDEEAINDILFHSVTKG